MTPPRRAGAALAGLALGTLAVVPATAAPVTPSAISSATPGGTTNATTTPAPTTYHLRASGRTVRVERGHLIRVSLTTASDGGYHWVVVRGRHGTTFTILSRRVVPPPASTQNGVPLVGGDSQTVYTLRARARGYATFKAIERRPWDHSDVAHRFTLHLRVTPSR
jgi:predicted secreted protein